MEQTNLLNATVDGEEETAANITEETGSMETTRQEAAAPPLSENGLKQKYGKLYRIEVVVDDDDEEEGRKITFLFRRPSTASLNRYVKNLSKNALSAATVFLRDSVIEEQKKKFDAEIEKFPALSLTMGDKLLGALGASNNINFRKL